MRGVIYPLNGLAGGPVMIDVTLAVLAGGDGSRMGFPKGELRVRGRPILPVLLEQFSWSGPTLLVIAPGREHPTGWEGFTREVVDPTAGQGPLRGVLTALENTTTPAVVVTAVDMPGVGAQHLTWVAKVLNGHPDALGVIPRRGGQVQPFPSALRAAAAPVLSRLLAMNHRSLHRLTEDPAFVAVDAPPDWEDSVWTNLNSPADMDALGD